MKMCEIVYYMSGFEISSDSSTLQYINQVPGLVYIAYFSYELISLILISRTKSKI